VNDIRGLHEHRDEWQIVDVREQWEWDAGHIEGALHLPLNEVMAEADGHRLDVARPIAVICRTGNRSELGALILQARGFDAHNVEGGMEAWSMAGLPFAASDGTPGRVA
jgi:rhodanese-related sulfurtransferase